MSPSGILGCVFSSHSNAPMSLSGFAALQSVENLLVPAALADIRGDWLLEVAPLTGPSPALDQHRVRMLFDSQGICWPFRARMDEWPLDDESVEAVLVRHVWQPGVAASPMEEILRVLKPGGLMVSVSANPWHRLAWRELGRNALRLPSWPHLQMLHVRHALKLSTPAVSQWRGLVPGVSPVLVLIARKAERPARIDPVRFARPKVAVGALPASQCRAA